MRLRSYLCWSQWSVFRVHSHKESRKLQTLFFSRPGKLLSTNTKDCVTSISFRNCNAARWAGNNRLIESARVLITALAVMKILREKYSTDKDSEITIVQWRLSDNRNHRIEYQWKSLGTWMEWKRRQCVRFSKPLLLDDGNLVTFVRHRKQCSLWQQGVHMRGLERRCRRWRLALRSGSIISRKIFLKSSQTSLSVPVICIKVQKRMEWK